MVSVNPRLKPAQGFPFFDPVNMSLPGLNSTAPLSGRNNTVSYCEDVAMKIRKPYTIKKSRENWTEQEHDKFIEALHLFDRDWKKIEGFVGSKTVVQIRSHAQKYFLKVQKSGANEHLPPPRPKRKATHPYPHKPPKNVVAFVSNVPSLSAPLLEPGYMYSSEPQAVRASTSSSWNHDSTNLPKPVVEEEPGVLVTALPNNRSTREDTRTVKAVTKQNDEEICEKPHRAMPNFAEVYSFIGSVFDPNKTGHLQRLKQMDPINMETVLLLMRNLSVNLTSPEFAEQRRLISSYSTKALK